MKLKQKFNTLTIKEYFFYIDNYKKYTDFNTLGLYRSITENTKLSLEDKIAVREYAHATFKKSFDFLQLKDPKTFFDVSTLGMELTVADERQLWDNIRQQQQKILSDKRIKHRNFGVYSKHNCNDVNCPYNGVMSKQDSPVGDMNMHFYTDRNTYPAKTRSEDRKSDRKNERQIVRRELDDL